MFSRIGGYVEAGTCSTCEECPSLTLMFYLGNARLSGARHVLIRECLCTYTYTYIYIYIYMHIYMYVYTIFVGTKHPKQSVLTQNLVALVTASQCSGLAPKSPTRLNQDLVPFFSRGWLHCCGQSSRHSSSILSELRRPHDCVACVGLDW